MKLIRSGLLVYRFIGLNMFKGFGPSVSKGSLVRPPPQLPPPLGEGGAPHRMSRSEDIWSAFNHQNEFLAEVISPKLHQPRTTVPMGCIRGHNGEKIIVIVHLFSGRRRLGDVHDWIAKLAPVALPDWTIWVLSFDTAVDAVRGNLTGENFETLLRIASTGLIAGGIGGPPCETFSAARHLPPPEGCVARWPRPLRSESHLWGIPGLSIRELRQLKVGSLLYFNCNLVEFAVALNGGVTLEEHPAASGIEGQASSWQSSLHKHFAAHVENSWPIRVDQWRFGADSVKPTVLRVMGAPSARFEIWRHTDKSAKRPLPKDQLRGLDSSTGEFKTASAKEYPTGLSKAIAQVILKEIQEKVAKGHTKCFDSATYPEEVAWLHDMHILSAEVRSDAVRLPDFQG